MKTDKERIVKDALGHDVKITNPMYDYHKPYMDWRVEIRNNEFIPKYGAGK